MTLICMKIKLHAELIFIGKVLQLDSFLKRCTTKLGHGPFKHTTINVFEQVPQFRNELYCLLLTNTEKI